MARHRQGSGGILGRWRGWRSAILSLHLLVGSAPSVAASEPAGAPVVDEPVVERIRFEADGPVTGISRTDLETLILLKPGEPFRETVARASVRRLYATEQFHDVQVETRELAGGAKVEVLVRLIRRHLVRSIGFDGDGGVGSRVLRRELTLREGEPFSESQVEESRLRIVEVLRRRGFLDPKVELDWDLDRELAQVDVVFRITGGAQARVADLQFDLEGPVDEAELRAVMETGVGGTYSPQVLEEDLERIGRLLARRGFFNSEVYLRDDGEELLNAQEVALNVRVVTRAATLVEFRGIESGAGELQDLPLFRSRRQSRLEVDETVRAIQRRLQEAGYFRASVRAEVQGEGFPPEKVLFEIDRGRKYSLDQIRFEGNRSVPASELVAVLQSRTAGIVSRGYLTEDSVREDRSRIQLIYQRQGYLDAAVESEIAESRGELVLAFRIAEGPRYYLGQVEIVGSGAYPDDQLLRELGFASGDPFSPFMPAAGRAALVSFYDRLGYREIRVEPRVVRREDLTVDLAFEVREGGRYRVEDVVFTGNRSTRRRVFEREVPIRAGDDLSLERNLAAETSLYSLSVFNRVRVREIPGREPDQRLVLFSVQESRKYSLFYGIGYGHSFGSLASEGARGTFGISDNNFLGMARTLSLNLRAGTRQQRANLTYNLPRPLGYSLPTVLSLTVDNEERVSEDAVTRTFRIRGRPYDAFRLIASSQSERVLSRRESLFFRYNFQQIRLDIPAGLEELLPLFREESRLRLSTLALSYLNESRDDPTDPRSGFVLNGDLSLAARAIGSERQFLRFLAQGRYYLNLYTDLTLAASLRLGFLEAFGGGTNPVPISERFFAGGATTLRGLPVDLAGPLLRDPRTGEVVLLEDNQGRRFAVPVGGNAMALANLELRFPVWNLLGGVLFYDAGNVFPEIAQLGGGEFSQAFGVGVAIRTPVGPVRIDAAYNPNPPAIEGFKRWNFHINIGHPF